MVVHRDLKPQNILLNAGPAGGAKVTISRCNLPGWQHPKELTALSVPGLGAAHTCVVAHPDTRMCNVQYATCGIRRMEMRDVRECEFVAQFPVSDIFASCFP